MKTFAFIFARGGSKGLKNKNIKKLNGKSLLELSINIAKKINQIEKIFVSTDSDKITKIALKNQVEVIKRPKKISKDNSNEWDAWRHAVKHVFDKYGKFDKFISLPATSPLKNISDVKKCLKLLDKKTDIVITYTQANRNPWFNMIKKKKNGYLQLVNTSKKNFFRRQDAPIVYDITTVCYVSKPKYIMEKNKIWDGNVKGSYVTPFRAIDIDNELDFKFAQYLISKKNK